MFYTSITDANGNVFPIAVNIAGHGEPTVDGSEGMFYVDLDSDDIYKCIGGTNWKKVQLGSAVQPPRISYVTLFASGWVGETSPYSQVVEIAGATENSQVDLTPSIEQLSIFHQKDLAFVTENDSGVITVYALGDKPQNDHTIQVTLTEVDI